MSLTSFSAFFSACFALVFSNNETSENDEHYKQELREFLDFVRDHTVAEIEYEKFVFESRYFRRGTKFDQMFENFLTFFDFALKNIHFVNSQTFYQGISTQMKKFVKTYNSLENFKYGGYGYHCTCCCNSISFKGVTYDIELQQNQLPYHLYHYYYDDNGNPIVDTNENDLKQQNAFCRKRKTTGKRKDFEKHVYNKGLNLKKRERTVRKLGKNKKDRDYCL